MRNQLKTSPIDPTSLFLFEQKELEKGSWTLVYKVEGRNPDGSIDFEKLLIGIAYKSNPSRIKLPFLRYFNYLNATGTPYASYDALIADLASLLDLGVSGGGGAGTDLGYVSPTGEVTSSTGANATITVMTGDSGSGGARGLVPDQVSGDASKVLFGNGTWGSIVAGAGLTKSTNTLNVGAGNGITVNADDVEVNADATGGANLATVVDVNSNGVAIKIDDTTIGENGSNQLEVKNNSIDENKLTTSVAGTGLTGGNGTALAVDSTVQNYTVVNTSTTPYTSSTGEVIFYDASGGASVVNLPAGATNAVVMVKKSSDTNTVTVDGNLAETIDGATTYVLSSTYEVATFRWNGTEWGVF